MHYRFSNKLAVLFLTLGCLAFLAVAQSFKPEQLRASFLYHIVHYTNFPDSHFEGNFVNFCFYEGNDPAHQEIFRSLPANKVKNRDTRIVEITNLAQVQDSNCQLLFVSRQVESDELFEQLQSLNQKLVSVGETRDFVERGGMITIVPLQSK